MTSAAINFHFNQPMTFDLDRWDVALFQPGEYPVYDQRGECIFASVNFGTRDSFYCRRVRTDQDGNESNMYELTVRSTGYYPNQTIYYIYVNPSEIFGWTSPEN